MNYHKFAYIYDELMKDAPYEEWVKLTLQLIEKLGINPKNIVDLGCGTGNIAIPLSKQGYQLTGIDLSEDMLSVAYDKMQENQVMFPLFQQNMMELELPHLAELIVSYCDSLNYLNGMEEVKQTFKQVHQNLEEGGYFFFDMHSPYKITKIFNQHSFAWNDEDISVIWLTDVDDEKLTVEHNLTFFVAQEDHLYEKFHEVHMQQTYTIEQVNELLVETGYDLVATYGDFQLTPVTETTERIFYVAKKR